MYCSATHLSSDNKSSLVTDMLSRLDNWLQTLPPHLKPEGSTTPTYSRAVSHLSLRYFDYMILLTRPYLLELEDRAHRFATHCEEANKRSIRELRTLVSHSTLSQINYFDGVFVLSNGMVLFLRALKWPTMEMLAELDEYLPILQAVHHLKIGRLAADAMASYAENLRAFLQITRCVRHHPQKKNKKKKKGLP